MPDSMGTLSQGALPPKKSGSKGLIIALVIIVVLAAAAYLVFGLGGSKVKPEGTNTNTPGNQTGTTGNPAEPAEIFSYVGTVEKVENGQIIVLAQKDKNLLAADASLTVKADANTRVIKRTIPKVLPKEGSTAGLFKQEEIALSDIAVGNQVTVVSATNIKGVTSFTASRIEVLNVQ